MNDETLPLIDLLVEIRRNSDGMMTTDVWKDWSYNSYWWDEGSAACDCNRELFWQQAQGIDTNDETHPCSHDKYSVRLSDNNSKEILYDEINNSLTSVEPDTRSSAESLAQEASAG